MVQRSPPQKHPCSRCGPKPEERLTAKPKTQSALPPSSPHTAHPPAKLQTKPGGDGGVEGSPQETLVKGCAVIGEEPFPHPVVSSGPRIVVKVNSPEEAILARVREQEVRKRPLDSDQYGHEKHARDQSNLPRLPVLYPLPEQIKGQRRNQDEDWKLRRNQVGDRVEHRAELRLGGEKRKNEDLCDHHDGVNSSRESSRPACAGCLREGREEEGQGNPHRNISNRLVKLHAPGVFLHKEHLAHDRQPSNVQKK